MLLKIYTDKNSLIVIENIENVEIHHSTFLAKNKEQIVACGYNDGLNWQQIGPDWEHGPVMPSVQFYGTGMPPAFASGAKHIAPEDVPVKYIDYQKNNAWYRVALDFFGTAYLCNDQGKTIERILEPGRLQA